MNSPAVFCYSYFVKWKDFGVDTLSLATKFNQYSPLPLKQDGVITLFRWRGRSGENCPRLCRQLGPILSLVLAYGKGCERLSCADGRAGYCS